RCFCVSTVAGLSYSGNTANRGRQTQSHRSCAESSRRPSRFVRSVAAREESQRASHGSRDGPEPGGFHAAGRKDSSVAPCRRSAPPKTNGELHGGPSVRTLSTPQYSRQDADSHSSENRADFRIDAHPV